MKKLIIATILVMGLSTTAMADPKWDYEHDGHGNGHAYGHDHDKWDKGHHNVIVRREYYRDGVRYYQPRPYYDPYYTYVTPYEPVVVAPRPVYVAPAPAASFFFSF